MDSVFFAMKPGETEYMDLLTVQHKIDNHEARALYETKTWDIYHGDNRI